MTERLKAGDDPTPPPAQDLMDAIQPADLAKHFSSKKKNSSGDESSSSGGSVQVNEQQADSAHGITR